MKKIEAIIRSSKFEQIREELSKININFFTFYEVQGFGRQKAAEVHYRGAVYDMGSISRTTIEVIVPNEKLEEVLNCITLAARTGEVGDGKIFISTIERVINIREGEEGLSAL